MNAKWPGQQKDRPSSSTKSQNKPTSFADLKQQLSQHRSRMQRSNQGNPEKRPLHRHAMYRNLFRKPHRTLKEKTLMAQSQINASSTSAKVHPCLLQSPGGICENASAGIQCPYRKLPAELCLNFLTTGRCPNRDSCPWTHEDVATYDARNSVKVQGVEERDESGDSQKKETLGNAQTYPHTSLKKWADTSRDFVSLLNYLCTQPGKRSSFASLAACLSAKNSSKCNLDHILYIVNLHRTLFEVIDGTEVRWKGKEVKPKSIFEDTVQDRVKSSIPKENPLPARRDFSVNLNNPFASPSVPKQRPVQIFPSIGVQAEPEPTDHFFKGTFPEHSLGAPHVSDEKALQSKQQRIALRHIHTVYEVYWDIIDACTSWADAQKHLQHFSRMHSEWLMPVLAAEKEADKFDFHMPERLVQRCIQLFSKSMHKTAGFDIFALFNAGVKDEAYALAPNYKLKPHDLSAMALIAPFLSLALISGEMLNCAQFLPQWTDWFGECILAPHCGVFSTTESILKNSACITGLQSVSHFVVHAENVHALHGFYTKLLMESLKMAQAGILSEKHAETYQQTTVYIFKVYLLTCLQIKRPAFALKQLSKLTQEHAILMKAQRALRDSGNALILKILHITKQKSALWKHFESVSRHQPKRSLLASARPTSRKMSENTAFPLSKGNQKGQNETLDSIPVSTCGFNSESLINAPLCAEFMLRSACETAEDIKKVMEIVFRSSGRDGSSPTTTHQGEDKAHEEAIRSCKVVPVSIYPPSRFRVLKAAMMKALSMQDYATATQLVKDYIMWAWEEKPFIGPAFHIFHEGTEASKCVQFRFPGRVEELQRLIGAITKAIGAAEIGRAHVEDLQRILTVYK